MPYVRTMNRSSSGRAESSFGRVPNFPAIHDDELLYSLVARYGFMMGYPKAASSNLDLFGHAANHGALRIPSGLAALAERLPTSLGLNAKTIALKHTLVPYYGAYFSIELYRRVMEAALALNGRASRIAGIDAKPLIAPRRLRFCPACLDDMEEADQDLHWKRLHQLAIVAVCPEHGCDLRKSAVRPDPTDRIIHPASRANCHEDARSVIPDHAEVDRDALCGLAERARTLLAGNFPVDAGPDKAGRLAGMFRDLGYRRRGRLDRELLAPNAQNAIAGLTFMVPEIQRVGKRNDGWFDQVRSPNRQGRSDRILIAAIVLERIAAIEPRFWSAVDQRTGGPLMILDADV